MVPRPTRLERELGQARKALDEMKKDKDEIETLNRDLGVKLSDTEMMVKRLEDQVYVRFSPGFVP